MNTFRYVFALLAAAVIATGCDKEENPPAGLDNQLKVGDTTFDLVEGKQTWFGTTYYPVNTAEISLVGDVILDNENKSLTPSAAIKIRFFVPGGSRKLVPGTYNIIPESKEGGKMSEINEWDCQILYTISDVPQGYGISGAVKVEVSGGEYTITANGIDVTNGNTPVKFVYKSPLEYSDKGTTGTSTFEVEDDIYEVAHVEISDSRNIGAGYSTEIKLLMRPADRYDCYLHAGITLYHRDQTFSTGTYTYTIYGGDQMMNGGFEMLEMVGNSMLYAGIRGDINTVTIAVDDWSGNYTISLEGSPSEDNTAITGSYTGVIL